MVKHKVIQNFQYLTEDKKIIILKSGVIIEDYYYTPKGSDPIKVDEDIVNNNGEYFQIVDWKQEMISYMKSNKISQPSVIVKKLTPFIEQMFVIGNSNSNSDRYEDIEFKQKYKDLTQKEINLENEYKTKIKEVEYRLTNTEIELEKQYRSKLKTLTEKESEYETKLKILEKKVADIEEDYSEINKKESEIRIKLNEIREKEESIRDLEYVVKQRERDLDRSALESTKNIDEKQKEFNRKLQDQLKDIEKRESELNLKLESLNTKEAGLYLEFDQKIKEYEDRYNEKLSSVNKKEQEFNSMNLIKIKDIEKMIINYYNEIPWYHNQMWEYKSKLESIINEFKGV